LELRSGSVDEAVDVGSFAGIDPGREPVPDETTVCRFRHLLEAHDLGSRLFEEVHRYLEAKGLKMIDVLRRASASATRSIATMVRRANSRAIRHPTTMV
jgi:IS5 family transposase